MDFKHIAYIESLERSGYGLVKAPRFSYGKEIGRAVLALLAIVAFCALAVVISLI